VGNLRENKVGGNDPVASDEPKATRSFELDRLSAENGEASDGEPKPRGGKTPIPDRMVAYARARAEFFRTPEHEAYATIREGGHFDTGPITSTEFARWITRIFYTVEGKVAYPQAVSSAVNALEGFALFNGATQEVHLRYAWHKQRIYLDLANSEWDVVEIDAEGWRLVRNPAVRFLRTPGMRALPTPVRGGSIEELRPFLNLRTHNEREEGDNRDWILSVGCLLAAMRPSGPYPVQVVGGEYGSGKSTYVRVYRQVVDSADPPHRAPPKNEHDLMVSALNNWVVALDNVSSLPPWLSDALCRLAMGAGFSARQLYTDKKEANIAVTRPVVLNGIGSIATRPDLLSRAIILNLASITLEVRRDEDTFWREFEQAHARILGALLDAVSHGLRHWDETHLARMPRMADFTRWVTACEGAFGWKHGTFLKAYQDHEAEKVDLALAESSIAEPIRRLAAKDWKGTAKQLATRLATMRSDGRPPMDERILSNELARLEPVLRDVGVVVTRRRTHGGTRLIQLSGGEGDAQDGATCKAADDDGDAGGGDFSVAKKRAKSERMTTKRKKSTSPSSPPRRGENRQIGRRAQAKPHRDPR
jgi:hypothetical protein